MGLDRGSLQRIRAGVTGQPNRTQPSFTGDGKSASLPQRIKAVAGLPQTNTKRNGAGPTPAGARGPKRTVNNQAVVTNTRRNSKGGPGLVEKPASKGSVKGGALGVD